VRALRFAAAAVLCIGLAVGASGCGGHSRRARARAGTLSIYTSLPFEGPYAADSRSIYDAEQLAIAQAGDVVNGFKVDLRRLDDASPVTRQWDPALVVQNAHIAAADPSTIAYIGELAPGSSLDSIPILGRAGVLEVSPGDTATKLAGRTFARVVPPDSQEALEQLAAMHKLGVKRLYVLKDRTTYGGDIATVATSNAVSYGIDVVDPGGEYLGTNTGSLVHTIKLSKAGALLYAGEPGAGVPALWNELSAANGRIKKFASASISAAPSWDTTTAAARANSFLSAPGLQRPDLPRAGNQFITEFLATYGDRVSWASGIFGYVAMSGVLEALYGVGPRVKDRRAKVLSTFLATKSLPSALGNYSIVDGQTTFRGYVFTRYYKYRLPTVYTP
jgi:branched-chain amino acid transport system substrate-binding protein